MFIWDPQPAVVPVPLHEIPLARLLDLPPADEERSAAFHERFRDGWLSVEDAMDGLTVEDFPKSALRGYRIGCWGDWRRGGVTAVCEATGRVAGGIDDRVFYVLPDHRGRGLGSEILVEAFRSGVKHPDADRGHTLTEAGARTRAAAHRLAVTRALAAGEAVPDEVLAAYADLATPGMRP